MLRRKIIEVETKKGISFANVTKQVEDAVAASGISEGMCNVFITATTAGIMLNEHELMLMEDFKRFFSQVDENRLYNHPSNAFSHIRAAMLSSSATLPVSASRLVLGKWQGILLWEFDAEPRKRVLIITVYDSQEKEEEGEKE